MDFDTYALEQAAETVYERPDTHGSPEDTFGTIAGFWNTYLEAIGLPPEALDEPDVAKMMILLKMARSAEGHYDEDNPVDVAGYAENWARLEQGNEERYVNAQVISAEEARESFRKN